MKPRTELILMVVFFAVLAWSILAVLLLWLFRHLDPTLDGWIH